MYLERSAVQAGRREMRTYVIPVLILTFVWVPTRGLNIRNSTRNLFGRDFASNMFVEGSTIPYYDMYVVVLARQELSFRIAESTSSEMASRSYFHFRLETLFILGWGIQ